uniref:Uncharacterized protein n=1 Tax=Psilocybe cubensis TaxID=181762 RepID=A0A8H8CK80_PSICU
MQPFTSLPYRISSLPAVASLLLIISKLLYKKEEQDSSPETISPLVNGNPNPPSIDIQAVMTPPVVTDPAGDPEVQSSLGTLTLQVDAPINGPISIADESTSVNRPNVENPLQSYLGEFLLRVTQLSNESIHPEPSNHQRLESPLAAPSTDVPNDGIETSSGNNASTETPPDYRGEDAERAYVGGNTSDDGDEDDERAFFSANASEDGEGERAFVNQNMSEEPREDMMLGVYFNITYNAKSLICSAQVIEDAYASTSNESEDGLHASRTARDALESSLRIIFHAVDSSKNRFIEALERLPDRAGQDLNPLIHSALADEKILKSMLSVIRQHKISLPIYMNRCGLVDVFDSDLSPTFRRTQHPRASTDRIPFYPCRIPEMRGLPSHYLFPLSPTTRREQGSPALVTTYAMFARNFDVFTGGAFTKLTSWDNIIVAGGSILACATTHSANITERDLRNLFLMSSTFEHANIDVFLYDMSEAEAKSRILQLQCEIDSALTSNSICVRRKHSIMVYSSWPQKPIKIAFRVYNSPAEILTSIDVDCAAILYDGISVYVTPRSLAAIVRQCNMIDLQRWSPEYEFRLAKYGARSYEVYIPQMERRKFVYEDKGLALLKTLEMEFMIPSRFERMNRIAWTGRSQPFLFPDSSPTSQFAVRVKETITAETILADVQDFDMRLSSPQATINEGRRLHRHTMFAGSMEQCLDQFCHDCPEPLSREEKDQVQRERAYIRGPVQFRTDDPGRFFVIRDDKENEAPDFDTWLMSAYERAC